MLGACILGRVGETVIVVDTGPIMNGFTAPEDAKCLVPPAVVEELDDQGVSTYEILERGLVTTFPADESVDRVRAFAEETGDLDVLSPADVSLLALAGEKEGTLVTDDYAMQNVAARMGVQAEAFSTEGISEELEWVWYCPACGEHEDSRKGECPVCGTELKRRPG